MAKNTLNNFKGADYKDTETLKKFLDQHSRVLSKYKSGLTASQQRKVALAIKRARFMALLPYTSK